MYAIYWAKKKPSYFLDEPSVGQKKNKSRRIFLDETSIGPQKKTKAVVFLSGAFKYMPSIQ